MARKRMMSKSIRGREIPKMKKKRTGKLAQRKARMAKVKPTPSVRPKKRGMSRTSVPRDGMTSVNMKPIVKSKRKIAIKPKGKPMKTAIVMAKPERSRNAVKPPTRSVRPVKPRIKRKYK